MTARRWRRTKKQYQDLFERPEALFPGVETTLWPNGEPEVWFQTKNGLGFRVKVSVGPAGLGIDVSPFAVTPDLTVMPTSRDVVETACCETRDVSVMQYNQDAWSQAFKAWCLGKGEYPDESEVNGDAQPAM